METKRYTRKSFDVDAIQVTAENIEEVARWCMGEVRFQERLPVDGGTTPVNRPYIAVRVFHPKNPRQTQAFIGDWVLYAGTGYKVYTPKAFEQSFIPSPQPLNLDKPLLEYQTDAVDASGQGN